MIVAGGKEFVSLNDEIFVGGKKVLEVYAGNRLVYPTEQSMRGVIFTFILDRYYYAEVNNYSERVNRMHIILHPYPIELINTIAIYKAAFIVDGEGTYGGKRWMLWVRLVDDNASALLDHLYFGHEITNEDNVVSTELEHEGNTWNHGLLMDRMTSGSITYYAFENWCNDNVYAKLTPDGDTDGVLTNHISSIRPGGKNIKQVFSIPEAREWLGV